MDCFINTHMGLKNSQMILALFSRHWKSCSPDAVNTLTNKRPSFLDAAATLHEKLAMMLLNETKETFHLHFAAGAEMMRKLRTQTFSSKGTFSHGENPVDQLRDLTTLRISS